MGTPRKILCPIDFGETGKEALNAAIELAGVLCAEILLLHVINPARFVVVCPEAYGFGAMTAAPVLNRAIESAKHTIQRVASDVLPSGVACQKRVVVGSPMARILGIARTEATDLIVMGTRRRPWWRRLLEPSLTEAVARRSTCPVMIVLGPAQSGDSGAEQWTLA